MTSRDAVRDVEAGRRKGVVWEEKKGEEASA